MALNAPDYFAGAPDVQGSAQNIFKLAGWIRRRCNEITAETKLDLIKIYDLARLCKVIRDEADKWIVAGEVTQILDALADHTRQATGTTKTTAEINTDYKALYQAAGNFLTWAQANLVGSGGTVAQAVTVTVNNAVGGTVDFTITIAKPAAVTTEVAALLAVYA